MVWIRNKKRLRRARQRCYGMKRSEDDVGWFNDIAERIGEAKLR